MTTEERRKKVFIQKLILILIAAAVLLFIIFFAANRGSAEKKQAELPVTEDVQTEEAAVTEPATETVAPQPEEQPEVTEQPEAVPAQTLTFVAAENDDGTGAAGQLSLSDYRNEAAFTPGWHSDDRGIWYSLGESFCYYNGWKEIDGQTYHFDSMGFASIGWNLIGSQSCCFDVSGAYIPDADNSRLIAFTFDDGPSGGMDQILELCEQTGARVTFFMIGTQVAEGGAVIPHIMRDRCELGNHSDDHTQALKLTPEESRENFARCDQKIAAYSGGVASTVIRYPYGDYTAEHLAVLEKPAIMWDIDTLDWESQNAESIVERVRTQLTEGDIILMHDRYDATVEACRVLFPELISQGYQLVTVSELAAAKGIALEPGVAYYNFRNDAIESGSYCTRG